MNANAQFVSSMLKFTFGLVPIIAGLDKFTNILVDWTIYSSSGMVSLLPFDANTFMGIVGVIEIGAGILVLVKPFIGAMVVSAWLVLIALTLIFGGQYLDVAVRDVVMAIGAFSLAKLSKSGA
ncbi:hypothetical protein QSE00_09370 [Arenibacter sp. M-2]|uniref:hypothetical protein n=1 Tax=unclassified Arenibacter TaxID=2615047 RepID=UPI000D769DFE|nr:MULTISPECIES: hypothetical protein [unclassified Arenibacter]MDL5512021.1 hypothetical protein [Arenibacter sp. M-2]PXX28417.1 hypothetical protein C7972_105272 [Arenibacter sp. ARW7G5Y1]